MFKGTWKETLEAYVQYQNKKQKLQEPEESPAALQEVIANDDATEKELDEAEEEGKIFFLLCDHFLL